MRILAVDDEALILQIIEAYMSWRGHTVTAAYDGLDGLRKFEQAPYSFDFVLADVHMPRMDGIEMVRQIRQLRFDISVAFITALERPYSPDEMIPLEPFDWLIKPFELAKMDALIRERVLKSGTAIHRGIRHRAAIDPTIVHADASLALADRTGRALPGVLE